MCLSVSLRTFPPLAIATSFARPGRLVRVDWMSLTRPSTAGPLMLSFGTQRRPGLNRQNTRKVGKTFVVCVDGSDQSARGLLLASALAKPGEDMVRVITINMGMNDLADDLLERGTPLGLVEDAKSELMIRGLPGRSISTKVVDPEELSVAAAIVKETTFLRRSTGLLVLGACGKGAQRRKGEAGKGIGSVADHVLINCKCPVTLVKEDPIYAIDAQPKSRRPPLKLVCCADRAQSSMGVFDAALRFCRAGDSLTVLHVATGRPEVEAKTEAYWKAEALKVNATSSVQVDVGCVPNTGRDVVDTILGNCHDYDVVVMGSLELVIAKGKIALGSIAHSVAKRCKAHVCIVKNFSCI